MGVECVGASVMLKHKLRNSASQWNTSPIYGNVGSAVVLESLSAVGPWEFGATTMVTLRNAMANKEATARIKINKLLEAAGWRFCLPASFDPSTGSRGCEHPPYLFS